MTEIPANHPRAKSLVLRERLVAGVKKGLTSTAGLIAHGRGEAFYYLLGERTHDFARRAIAAASAMLITAKHPVFSVNGNVAAVVAESIVALVGVIEHLRVEVNIFHFDEARMQRMAAHLKEAGLTEVLGLGEFDELAGLESARRRMDVDGISQADLVLVPLEDGDRCEALIESGRSVITVDLNPFARTSQTATVTIVDEVTTVIPLLVEQARQDLERPQDELLQRIADYDNQQVLSKAEQAIRSGV